MILVPVDAVSRQPGATGRHDYSSVLDEGGQQRACVVSNRENASGPGCRTIGPVALTPENVGQLTGRWNY